MGICVTDTLSSDTERTIQSSMIDTLTLDTHINLHAYQLRSILRQQISVDILQTQRTLPNNTSTTSKH